MTRNNADMQKHPSSLAVLAENWWKFMISSKAFEFAPLWKFCPENLLVEGFQLSVNALKLSLKLVAMDRQTKRQTNTHTTA